VYDADDVVVIGEGVAPIEPGTSSGILGGAPYILGLGRTVHRKQFPLLVAAFGLLAGELSDLHLVLAGSAGEAEAEVVREIAALPTAVRSRVDRKVDVDDRDRDRLLLGASVLAHPSRYEGFGLPILEAYAAGVPVVAAPAMAVLEIAGTAALLTSTTSDPIELAEALRVAIIDSERRAKMIGAGHVIADRFTWRSTAEEMAALYRRVAAERSVGG
jgi:glycosyltransferase involved in cell wall biosynthesis